MLPNEPEVLAARLPFTMAQEALFGTIDTAPPERYVCGWYGSAYHPDRGCYAVVHQDGPLVDLVGDRLRLKSLGLPGLRETLVYCFASGDLPYDIAITRRSFAALELLSQDSTKVFVEVLSG